MEPNATRPHMPGYGILPATEGTGLLPWSWAVERLTASHDYWVTTTWPDGRPHLTPVWGAWLDDAVWFSCSGTSRKTKNLERDPRCSIATDNPYEPVIIDAVAERVRAMRPRSRPSPTPSTRSTRPTTASTSSATTRCGSLDRQSAFALDEADFPGSPTRWRSLVDRSPWS